MSGTTITSSTSLSTSLVLSKGETLSVQAGVTVQGGAYNASYLIGAPSTASGVAVDNSGALLGNNSLATNESAISLGDGGMVSNAATGSIEGNASGIVAAGGVLNVYNRGVISGILDSGIQASTATIVNAASADISGTMYGISAASLSLVNMGEVDSAGGTAVEAIAGTVNNYGAIQGGMDGVNLSGGGEVVNDGGMITGLAGDGVAMQAGTVINESSSSGILGAMTGVAIAGPGSLVNQGIVGGSTDGAALGSGTVINTGTLVGLSTGVSVSGPGYVMNSGLLGGIDHGVALASGTVVNQGLLAAGNGSAVSLAAGGTVVNGGTLASLYGDGVKLGTQGGMVINSGYLAGGENGVASAGGLTLTNTGTLLGYDISGLQQMAPVVASGLVGAVGPVNGLSGGMTLSNMDNDPSSQSGGQGNSIFGLEHDNLQKLQSVAPGFDDNAVSVAGSVSLTNSGLIESAGGAGVYVDAQGASMLDIANAAGGTIAGINGIDVIGTPSAGTVFTLVNAGTIEALPSNMIMSENGYGGLGGSNGGWGNGDGGDGGDGVTVFSAGMMGGAGGGSGGDGGMGGAGGMGGPGMPPGPGMDQQGFEGIAVLDTGSPAQVIIDPTGTFEGAVIAADTSAMNSITLASGSQEGTIVNLGTFYGFQNLYVQNGATWTIEDNLGNGTPVISIGGGGADLTLDQNVAPQVTVNLAPAGTLTLADLDGGRQDPRQFKGEIGTVGYGSEIDFSNLPYDTSDTLTVDLSGKNPHLVLTATGMTSGPHPHPYTENITINLDPSVNYNGDNFHLVPGAGNTEAIETSICFASGTHLLTPRGEVAVECLGVGDEVVTVSGNKREKDKKKEKLII